MSIQTDNLFPNFFPATVQNLADEVPSILNVNTNTVIHGFIYNYDLLVGCCSGTEAGR